MKLLFCVQFYYPSIGGVQEVIKQLAEKLAAKGHEVVVATATDQRRNFEQHNSVTVRQFAVSGNRVQGIVGDVETYRRFLCETDADLVFFYAAQQWSFDAAWEVMDCIKGKKVLVPCGYSALHVQTYRQYFAKLPDILQKFDRLIYHARSYRDYAFGELHGLHAASLIPNGADDAEFSKPVDPWFGEKLGIGDTDLVLMTVGTLNGMKGHQELATAFRLANFPGRRATLVLNGNAKPSTYLPRTAYGMISTLLGNARSNGWPHTAKVIFERLLSRFGLKLDLRTQLKRLAAVLDKESGGTKRLIVCDLPRDALVQLYLRADLFVFASRVEYSPLVLFEACAAGLPFLSAPVGNAAEIAAWTGGGEIYAAEINKDGFTQTEPATLARHMEDLMGDAPRRHALSMAGREASQRRFNWRLLAEEYESLFLKLVSQ